mmetsp:Transcript_7209/g.9395  ORF Transcript_7209/g.9395 Transcript_7209/m.9395 type:complete len:182 (+) Transcript_7209:45-590(+)
MGASNSTNCTSACAACAGFEDDAADAYPGQPLLSVEKYRVVGKSGATVREGYSVKSKIVKTIPCGTVVEVVEVQGLRVNLVSPVPGWASLKTEKGYVIIDKITGKQRYRVIYPDGIPVRSGINIDKSQPMRHLAYGEVIEGTGRLERYEGVERIEVVGGGWISKNTREDGGKAGDFLIERL